MLKLFYKKYNHEILHEKFQEDIEIGKIKGVNSETDNRNEANFIIVMQRDELRQKIK